MTENPMEPNEGRTASWPWRWLRVLRLFLILLGVWLLLSGKMDLLHVGLGVLTVVLLIGYYFPAGDRKCLPLWRLAKFIPGQLLGILISNIHVARLVLARRLRIDPVMIRRKPEISGDIPLTILGASITLTPGTLTVEIDADHLLVHALDRVSLRGVTGGVIDRQVGRIFSPD